MVLQTRQPIKTVDEFIAYAMLPENVDRNLEFINGKVVEKLGSTTQNAQIPMLLSALVINHCDANNIPCFVTGADGEYCIDDWCFIPSLPTSNHLYRPPIPIMYHQFGQSKSSQPNAANTRRQVSCFGKFILMTA